MKKKIVISIAALLLIVIAGITINSIMNNDNDELVSIKIELPTVAETIEEPSTETTTVYEDLTENDHFLTNADRGNAQGTVVENEDITQDAGTAEVPDYTMGESKDYKVNEDGTWIFSTDFIASISGTRYLANSTAEEITDWLNSDASLAIAIRQSLKSGTGIRSELRMLERGIDGTLAYENGKEEFTLSPSSIARQELENASKSQSSTSDSTASTDKSDTPDTSTTAGTETSNSNSNLTANPGSSNPSSSSTSTSTPSSSSSSSSQGSQNNQSASQSQTTPNTTTPNTGQSVPRPGAPNQKVQSTGNEERSESAKDIIIN